MEGSISRSIREHMDQDELFQKELQERNGPLLHFRNFNTQRKILREQSNLWEEKEETARARRKIAS